MLNIRPILRHHKHALTLKYGLKRWLAENARHDSYIHETIEFSGHFPPFKLIQIGRHCRLARDISIYFSSQEHNDVTIGDHCFIGRNSMISVFAPVSIGVHTMIAPYCSIITANHAFERRDIPMQEQGIAKCAAVTLEDDVWLGTQVVVLPGVRIGRGAIVAAGSVVNRDIPSYEIWGGVPARFIKHRP